MSNPTTPFNWQMPTNTDLVTDLPADFEVFGQAVATSMADLLGGTTGQILAKNSNTDMDFVWIANDQGDITGVTATSPLTGGGTSGAITVGIQASSTTQSGAVQLTDSTSSTSTTTAATPNSVKTSYDLAAAAVPKSTVTTAGDVIYATGSSAVTRLGIGTAGQVLTVNGGGTAPSWATPTTGGMTLLSTITLSGTTTTWNSITTGYKYLKLVGVNLQNSTTAQDMDIRVNGGTTGVYVGGVTGATANQRANYTIPISSGSGVKSGTNLTFVCDIYNYDSSSVEKVICLDGLMTADYLTTIQPYTFGGVFKSTTAITSLVVAASSGTLSGTIYAYGVK